MMKQNRADEHRFPSEVRRRDFLKWTAGFAAGLATTHLVSAKQGDLSTVPLGLVNHSLRGMRWKAAQFIEYAAGLKLDAIQFNALDVFESLDDAHLASLKQKAASHGIRLYVGAGSICRNSTRFSDRYGSPEQIVQLGIRVAKAVGSPLVVVRIGTVEDRYTEGGIRARMEETTKLLRASRNLALDNNLKFAFENHAGDLRSDELLEIVTSVGADVCGVMLDPGNAVWALEDPMVQVQRLGKYTICTSIRDYMVWPSENGATFQWTALGDGLMDVRAYVGYLAELCPGVSVNVETISNDARPLPFLTDEFMKGFPDLRAGDLLDFLRLLRRGHPLPLDKPAAGQDQRSFDQEHQRHEFEKSIAYLRNVCGAGRKVQL